MRINKAGVIVFDQEMKRVLLVHRLKKNDWSFPKGHAENEEKPEETAARETLEETGYTIRMQKSIPDLLYKNDSGEDIKVSMFLAYIEEKVCSPEQGTEIVWFPIHDVEKQLSYNNLKEYWRTVRFMIS